MTKQEIAKGKLHELDEKIRGTMMVTPKTITFVEFFRTLQEMYFWEEYDKVIAVCSAFIEEG